MDSGTIIAIMIIDTEIMSETTIKEGRCALPWVNAKARRVKTAADTTAAANAKTAFIY